MKIRTLKYLEIFYLTFLFVASGSITFGFPHLQAVCIISFVLGFCLTFFGFAYFLAYAMINSLDLLVSNKEASSNMYVNTTHILKHSVDYFVAKLTNRKHDLDDKIGKRFGYYFISGIILIFFGLILTLLFDYLNLI